MRPGSTHLSATLCVPTGQVAHDLTATHNGNDFLAHLRHAVQEMPKARRYHWVVDDKRTLSTPAVCALVAELSGLAVPEGLETAKARQQWLSEPGHRHVFHFTPVRGSWLNQVEMFFSVLTRKLLRRDDFASKESFEERLRQWLEYYNREWAHPYRWTYAGTPLCGTRRWSGRAGNGTAGGPFSALGRSASSACSIRRVPITRRPPRDFPATYETLY